jgi:hypothetical protein
MFLKITKILLVVSLLAGGIVSCSSCSGNTPAVSNPDPTPSVSAIPPTPIPLDTLVKKDNYEFTLPGNSWNQVETCKNAGCPVAYMNKDNNAVVAFMSENTSDTLDKYVLSAIRGMKDAGANISSTKQIDLNGHKFVLVESSKNNVKVWMWITLLNGQGYGLSCGAPDDVHDLCFAIANTLKIN